MKLRAFLLLLVIFSLFSVELASASIGAKKDYTVFWHPYDDDYYNSAIGVYSDIAGNLNATNYGSDNSTGKVNDSADFVKANGDHQRMNFSYQDGQLAYTIMFWLWPDTTWTGGGTREFILDFNTSATTTIISTGGGGDQSGDCTGETMFLYDGDTAGEICYYGNIGGGTWHHVAWRWNSTLSRYELFLNASRVSTDSGSTGSDYVQLFDIYEPWVGARKVSGSAQASTLLDGKIDELAIYNISLSPVEIKQAYDNMTAGVTWPFGNFTGGGGSPPVTQNASVSRQSTFSDNTSNNITVGTQFVTILNDQVTIEQNTTATTTATVNIYGGSFDSVAVCRIDVDGQYYDTTRQRSNTAESYGSLYLTSSNITLTNRTIDISLECQRGTNRNFIVTDASVQLNLANNNTLKHYSSNQLGLSSGYTVLSSGTYTTTSLPQNSTVPMVALLNYDVTYNYTGTGYNSVIYEFGGRNCTEMPRYGAIGTTGSGGGACMFNVTNNTAYTYKIHGRGTGSINSQLTISDMIVSENEYNTTNLTGTFTGTEQSLANISLTSLIDEGNYRVVVGIPVNGSSNASFYVKAYGETTQQTPLFRRTVTGETGIAVIDWVFGADVVDTNTNKIELVGNCPGATCTLDGGELVGYVSEVVSSERQGFTVFVNRSYNFSGLPGFTYNSSLLSITTEADQVFIPTSDSLVNFSIIKDGFFTETVTNHNTNKNITVNLSDVYMQDYKFRDLAGNVITASPYNVTVEGGRTYTDVTNTTKIHLKEGNTIVSFTVPGYYTNNVTISASTTPTVNNTDVINLYNNRFTISGHYDGTPITGFNGSVSNSTIGISNTTAFSGVTGTFNLLQGYLYTFTYNNTGYTIGTANITVNASTQSYNFSLLRAETFNLSIYDELTNQLINDTNFSISFISDGYATNVSTATGLYNISLLVPGDYSIRYSGDGYRERDYISTITPQSFQSIRLYSIDNSSSDLVTVTVKDTSTRLVENATVSLLRYFLECNCYRIVEMSYTSFSGEALFWVEPFNGYYKWSIDYKGLNRLLTTTPETITTNTRTFTVDTGENYYTSQNVILTQVSKGFTVNYDTGSLSYTWADASQTVTQVCLKLERATGVRWVVNQSSCQSASTGSIAYTGLDLNATTYRATATFSTNTRYSEYTDSIITDKPQLWSSVFNAGGGAGYVLGAGVVMGLGAIGGFIGSVAVLILTTLAVIVLNLLGLMPFSQTFVIGLGVLTVGFSVLLLRR